MSVVLSKTDPKAVEVLSRCLPYFQQLSNLEMTAADEMNARRAERCLRRVIDSKASQSSSILETHFLPSIVNDVYVLVLWPFVQDLMECEWFCDECILYQASDEQEHLDSAYFVPIQRIIEINQPG